MILNFKPTFINQVVGTTECIILYYKYNKMILAIAPRTKHKSQCEYFYNAKIRLYTLGLQKCIFIK